MTTSIPEWEEEIKAAKAKHKTPRGSSAGCLLMIVLFTAIVISMIVLGIQTKAGCELVANYLKRQTGLDLTVGGARFDWPPSLHLADVQTKPSTTPLGSFKARELILAMGWGKTVEVTLKGGRLEVVRTADGWVPAPFSKVASLTDVRDTAALFSEDPTLVAVDVRDSALVWNGPDGDRLAAVEGASLSVRRVVMGDRVLRVYDLAARTVYRTGARKGRSVRRLWASIPETPYLEIEYRGEWEGKETDPKDWWSDPPVVVKRGTGL